MLVQSIEQGGVSGLLACNHCSGTGAYRHTALIMIYSPTLYFLSEN